MANQREQPVLCTNGLFDALSMVGPNVVRSATAITLNKSIKINYKDKEGKNKVWDIPSDTFVTGLTGYYDKKITIDGVDYDKLSWTIRQDYDSRPEKEKGVHVNVSLKAGRTTRDYAFIYKSSVMVDYDSNGKKRVRINGNYYIENLQRFSATVHWDIREKQPVRGYDRSDVMRGVLNEWFRVAFSQ